MVNPMPPDDQSGREEVLTNTDHIFTASLSIDWTIPSRQCSVSWSCRAYIMASERPATDINVGRSFAADYPFGFPGRDDRTPRNKTPVS